MKAKGQAVSEKELQIFELCEKLAELLGDKEAIANLKLLYEHHPEMFKDMQDVSLVIEEVVKSPELIMKAKREGAILASKILQDGQKMGEIAIENDNGTNIVFHANKKRIKEFYKLKNSLVETPTPSTHRSESAGELMDKNPSGANAHSANFENTIPNPSLESQILSEEEKLLDEMLKAQEKINDMPRVKDFKEDFEKDLEKSFNVKTSEENLQKDNEGNLKLRLKQ